MGEFKDGELICEIIEGENTEPKLKNIVDSNNV